MRRFDGGKRRQPDVSVRSVPRRRIPFDRDVGVFEAVDDGAAVSLDLPFDGDVGVFEAVDDGAAVSLHSVVVGVDDS